MSEATYITYQINAFIVTIVLGMFIGLAFDFFRVIRSFLRLSRSVLFFGDFIFWLIMTLIVFLGLLASNWGEVRAYVFIGLALGGSFYVLFLSKTIFRLMYFTFEQVRQFLKFILSPFLYLLRKLIVSFKRITKTLRRIINAGRKNFFKKIHKNKLE